MYYKLGQACVTNWSSYYKLRQPLLQNRAGITNWSKMYYKLGQVLQIRAIITNWGITGVNKNITLNCESFEKNYLDSNRFISLVVFSQLFLLGYRASCSYFERKV